MTYRLNPQALSRLTAHLDELFSKISGRVSESLSPDLADEIAATAGEVMVELADHRGDELTRGVIEDARRLRELVRSLSPESTTVARAGRALVSDLELFIRDGKRAA